MVRRSLGGLFVLTSSPPYAAMFEVYEGTSKYFILRSRDLLNFFIKQLLDSAKTAKHNFLNSRETHPMPWQFILQLAGNLLSFEFFSTPQCVPLSAHIDIPMAADFIKFWFKYFTFYLLFLTATSPPYNFFPVYCIFKTVNIINRFAHLK